MTWFLVIYFWPLMLLYVFKRAILVKGFGEGPIPVNTLYTEPPCTKLIHYQLCKIAIDKRHSNK